MIASSLTTYRVFSGHLVHEMYENSKNQKQRVSIYRKFILCHGVAVIWIAFALCMLAENYSKLNAWQLNFNGKIPREVMTKIWNLRNVGNKLASSHANSSNISKILHECEPRTHVGFLKTHKTGSSTIFNILSRVAISKNIPVVVPPGAHLCHPAEFTRTRKCMVDPEKYHSMLFNHVRFSSVVRETIPPDSFWFTILRQPLDFFESTYVYYRADRLIHVNFETFISNHQKYLPELKKKKGNPYLYSLEKDLGFAPQDDISSSAVIEHMEKNFDLVIVSTYFDHGLCYLKQALCWTYDDVVYLEQNQRSNKRVYKPEERTRLNAIIREVIPVYVHVFDYFEKKFRDAFINTELDSEVERFRGEIEAKKEKCLESGKATKSKDELLIPKYQPVPISSYALKNHSTECMLLAMPESSLTKCLRNKESGFNCP